MASAAAVAERFRQLSGNTLTPLQLLKLVYIAHGWSFPLRNQGLIDESVEAWQYGPVIPSLYHSLKRFRASPVNEPIDAWPPRPLNPDEQALIDQVYKVYGKYSGGQLSAMTHREGTPWAHAYNGSRNSRITDKMVEDHYRRLHTERNG
jgi:uncharacterized phage-associated protein